MNVGRANRHSRWKLSFWLWAACGLLVGYPLAAAEWVVDSALGLRVLRGFQVTEYAGPDLAPDAAALTVDGQGDVVVSGPGYVRRLLDLDEDGMAEGFEVLLPPDTGGQGLAFTDSDLYVVGKRGVELFEDEDEDGVWEALPGVRIPLNNGEHGGHSIRLGPDGGMYVSGGWESGFGRPRPNRLAAPPLRAEGGAILVLRPESGRGVLFADGFRNPYDFAWNNFGDVFAWDNDQENDVLMPWHEPPRLYEVTMGARHGWQQWPTGQGTFLPEYDPANVPALASLYRGAPAGQVCYRHFQFPLDFRGDLFFADWVMGRVYHVTLSWGPLGYEAMVEPFLESVGRNGFAPTDLAVGADGSLFIATGGRKTRGGVYRIQYVEDPAFRANAIRWAQLALTDLDLVFGSPQSDATWSRDFWVPVARRLGPEIFAGVVAEENALPAVRLRAIEILTEFYGGLDESLAARAVRAASPLVRSRAAWSLGWHPQPGDLPLLFGLVTDPSPYVRRQVLAVLQERAPRLQLAALQQIIGLNLAHPDKRVRQAAARIAMALPPPAWTALWERRRQLNMPARLALTLALLWREPPSDAPARIVVEEALALLGRTRDPGEQLAALCLVRAGLGDGTRQDPGPAFEVFCHYDPAFPEHPEYPGLAMKIVDGLGGRIPFGDRWLDLEATRLLAMVRAESPGLPRRVASLLTPQAGATEDFHYLAVLTRLGGEALTNQVEKLATAILSLDRKLAEAGRNHRGQWDDRLAAVVAALVARNHPLSAALLEHESFATPGHVALVACLDAKHRLEAAGKFLRAVRRDRGFAWSEALVDVLASLPAEAVKPLFRLRWKDESLRERLLMELTRSPAVEDREKFLWGLQASDLDVVRACAIALQKLPRDNSSACLVPIMRLLKRMVATPAAALDREHAMALVRRQTGVAFQIREGDGSRAALRSAYQPVFDWFRRTHPTLVRPWAGTDSMQPSAWEFKFKSVRWANGDPDRGAQVFRELNCAFCHQGQPMLGPSLRGIRGRLTREGLWEAIVYPDWHAAAPHRATVVQTRDRMTYTGAVVYEGPEMLLLQTGPVSTVRVDRNDIVSRYRSQRSLMPTGLIDKLSAPALADLDAFLGTGLSGRDESLE